MTFERHLIGVSEYSRIRCMYCEPKQMKSSNLPKRILIVIPTITSYHMFLEELAGELNAEGWEVHLACVSKPIAGFDCYEAPKDVQVHHIDFPRGANPVKLLLAARLLRRLVVTLRPAIIHSHFAITSLTAAIARSDLFPPTIATIHGLTFAHATGIRKGIFGFCERWSQRHLDGTWVLTQCDVNAFRRIGVLEKVFLHKSMGIGCRLDIFDRDRYQALQLLELRKELGIGRDDFVFAFVGRQVHFKGFAVVIRAFMGLVADFPETKLLLIGVRDPRHPTGLSRAEESNMNTSSSIISVGWVRDVPRYLALAHANVFPSNREGMPVNLMESLAMGVPVITSDSRGCRDVVRHNVDGLVVDGLNVTSFGDAMRSVIASPPLRARFEANALADRRRLDRSAWIAEQISIYAEVLNHHGGQGVWDSLGRGCTDEALR